MFKNTISGLSFLLPRLFQAYGLLLSLEDADFPYEEVRTLNDILIEAAALRAQPLVDNNRKFSAAPAAASYRRDALDDELRSP